MAVPSSIAPTRVPRSSSRRASRQAARASAIKRMAKNTPRSPIAPQHVAKDRRQLADMPLRERQVLELAEREMAQHIPAPAEIEQQRRQRREQDLCDGACRAARAPSHASGERRRRPTPSASATLSCLMLTSAARISASSHEIVPRIAAGR